MPFRSAHQAEIVAPFAAASVVAELDVRVADRTGLISLSANDGSVEPRRSNGDVSISSSTMPPPPETAPTRNLMGFKDGTANPDRSDGTAIDHHVWIQPNDGQPI